MSGNILYESNVAEIAELSFARGKVGQRYPLTSDEEKAQFAQELAERTLALTISNTADCGDERFIVSFADGQSDQEIIAQRVAPQLFGGLALASMKACVAAEAAVVKDAKNAWDAYVILSELLAKMGQEDAGHAGCGASGSVESSVANAIDRSLLIPSIGLFVPNGNGQHDTLIDKNSLSKSRRLEEGFYGVWDPAKHQEYLIEKFPHNFAYLLDTPDHEDAPHGHNGSGMYVVTAANQGFQRNGKAFAVSRAKMRELSLMLGGSDEERARIMLGFADDTLHVGAGIVTEDFPVFADAA